MLAPVLMERFGWIETDICWWCGSGRQNREHCFKECITWRPEIKGLWKSVGEVSGSGKGSDNVYKGKALVMASKGKVDQETQRRESYWQMEGSQRLFWNF